MNILRKSLGLWCKIVGHKWRRLRKSEKSACTGFPAHERICDRCELMREVKAQKVKAPA